MEIREKMVIFIEQECDLSLNFKNLTFRFEFTIGFKVKKNMTRVGSIGDATDAIA